MISDDSDEASSIASSDDSFSEHSSPDDCEEPPTLEADNFDQILNNTYRSELKSLSQEIVSLLARKSALTSRLQSKTDLLESIERSYACQRQKFKRMQADLRSQVINLEQLRLD